ncbi:hypothetical protein JHU04_003947 [Brenneria sp. 4F2]|nr:hypothetical protein [Brenneria bubanii]
MLAILGWLGVMIFGDDFLSFLAGPFGIFAVVALFILYIFASGLMRRGGGRGRNRPGDKTSLWNTVLKILLLMVFFSIPFLGIYGLLPFIAIMIAMFMSSNDERRFLKYQETLPTSKIRAMTTGLVELEGQLHAQSLVKSPLSRHRCIGYYHTVHEEVRYSDGERRYRLIHQESHCQPFVLQDATGKVQVDGENLHFHLLPLAKKQRSSNRIAREYLLLSGGSYLLIGQAVRRDGEMVIIRDHYRRVFGIAPLGHLKRRGKLDGLLRTFTFYSVAIAFMVALFMTLPVEIKGHHLLINYANWSPLSLLSSSLSGITQ